MANIKQSVRALKRIADENLRATIIDLLLEGFDIRAEIDLDGELLDLACTRCRTAEATAIVNIQVLHNY
jgi:hypothetical protein